MVRNLTKTLAAVSLLTPASAYSLGIGDIKLHSALNQKLNAEIALLVSAEENASSIEVRLAPPEKFDEAGVPWNYFLSKIKFESSVRSDGSTVIKLSSNEVLREPFLDFLLEVSWDKGNLYREFTVLIDPPVAYTQPVIPVIQKAKQIEEKPQPQSEPVVSVAPAMVDMAVEDSSYGPTTSTDTVWKIAEQSNHHADVSIEQMMMAIYQANPRAFYKKNVNALMAEQTLAIPEKEVILKLTQEEALAAFKQQENMWTGRVGAKVDKQSVDTEKTDVNSQLELKAPVEEEVAESVVIVSDDGEKFDAVDPESGKDELAISSSEETLVLQARMEKLEQQLLLMQKMLVLKDEQIAALQNKGQLMDSAIVDTAVDKVDTTVDKTVKTEEKVELKKETVTSENKPINEAKKKIIEKVAKKPKPKPKPIVQPEPELIDDSFALTVGGIGVGILGVLGWFWWRKRKGQEQVETESMFAYASEISLPDSSLEELSRPVVTDDQLTPVAGDSTSYDVGTVGESSFLSEFTPSDFDAFDTDQNEVDPISEADVYLAYGRYQQAEELMRQAIIDQPDRDECKLKLLEIFYANENASAFETYAEELVSVGKDSDHAFWEKVVDMGVELAPESSLFVENGGEKASFESVPLDNEKTQLDDKKDSLLAEGTVDSLAANVDTEEESSSEMDFDLSVFDEDDEIGSGDGVNVKDDTGLDFDLSVFDLDDSTAEIPEETEPEEIEKEQENESENLETVDFDLNTLALEDSVDETSEEKVSKPDELESFDFSLDELAEPIENNQDTEELVLSADSDSSDDSLESFDFNLDSKLSDSSMETESSDDNEPLIEESTSSSKADELESFDFDFDFDTPPVDVEKNAQVSSVEQDASSDSDTSKSLESFDFELDTPSSGSEFNLDEGVSDLTDMDELETKIDLAKAYIDMEDFDAAKGIAEEVLEKGTAEQKTEAQTIIDQLK